MSFSPSLSTASSASTRVRSTTRSNLIGAWVFAVLWTLISAPILFFIPRELQRKPIAAIGFVFPIIGIGLLAWAVMLTLRWRRFGQAWFEMAAPASSGGMCAGSIRTRLDRPSPGDRLVVTVKLTCLQRIVSGRGKHRSVREHILWREEQDVPAEHILFTPTGAAIPIQFALPADALETTASKRSGGVFWALTVDASLPGVDLHEDFDVPVYGGAMAQGPVQKDGPYIAQRPVPEDGPYAVAQSAKEAVTRQDLAAAGIHVRQTEAGVEYHFGAARNPSFAIGLTTFLLIWTGALSLQIAIDAPVFFPLLTGLFELLLLVITADLWLGTTTFTVGPHTVRCRQAIAGLGATRVIASTDIVKIDLHISMQTTGRTGTPYYEIRATTGPGRHRSLGSGIRNKAHAEWLAQEMRSAIGLRS
jgi:hypothetical protein